MLRAKNVTRRQSKKKGGRQRIDWMAPRKNPWGCLGTRDLSIRGGSPRGVPDGRGQKEKSEKDETTKNPQKKAYGKKCTLQGEGGAPENAGKGKRSYGGCFFQERMLYAKEQEPDGKMRLKAKGKGGGGVKEKVHSVQTKRRKKNQGSGGNKNRRNEI